MKSLPVPALNNDITNYITNIEKFPILTAEQELELINRYKNENDIKAAQQLILSNLRFVVKIANEYKKFGFPLKDLIQEGNLGLIKAIKHFDPSKGCRKFISYAVWWIRAQIHEYIMKSWSLVKIGTTQLQKRLFYKFADIDKELETDSHEITKQLADDFNVTEEKIIELKNRMQNSDVSLDMQMNEEGSSFINLVKSPYKSPEEEVIEKEREEILKNKLVKALDVLNDKEKYIITQRYLIENPKTLQEIGDEFNITRERVRQIEKKALEKIRKHLPKEIVDIAAA